MTHFDLIARSPVERWTHLLKQLRKAQIDRRTMTDIRSGSDAREQAAETYSQHSEAVLAELDALDCQGALHDVPELLDLTYGRA